MTRWALGSPSALDPSAWWSGGWRVSLPDTQRQDGGESSCQHSVEILRLASPDVRLHKYLPGIIVLYTSQWVNRGGQVVINIYLLTQGAICVKIRAREIYLLYWKSIGYKGKPRKRISQERHTKDFFWMNIKRDLRPPNRSLCSIDILSYPRGF